METRRGADRPTAQELRKTREAWWDESFTRTLVECFPSDPSLLVDVGCGLATAADRLLPGLRALSYLGIDVDRGRLSEAEGDLAGAPWASRVRLAAGTAEALPVGDALVDVALSVATLQHLRDVPTALAEMVRVLRPGGRLIAAEPDNLGQRFYFDRPLDEFNRAYQELTAVCRAARRPADLSIGPDRRPAPRLGSRPSVLGSRSSALGPRLSVLGSRPSAVSRRSTTTRGSRCATGRAPCAARTSPGRFPARS